VKLNNLKQNSGNIFCNFLGVTVGTISLCCGLAEAFSGLSRYLSHGGTTQAAYEYDFIYLMLGGTISFILGIWAKNGIPRGYQTEDQ